MKAVDNITTPQSLATKAFPLLSKGHNDHITPRDRWFQNLWNKIYWTFYNRFTVRVNWAPNFFLSVKAEIYSARSMLTKGKITWKANEEDMGNLQQEQELQGQETSLWPCPRLYVHLSAKEDRIQIPAPSTTQDESSTIWKIFVAVAESYMGPLTGNVEDPDATSMTPIPVHLILEPLYLLVIPQTALTLLAILVPLIAVTIVWVLPPIAKALKAVASEQHHIKTD